MQATKEDSKKLAHARETRVRVNCSLEYCQFGTSQKPVEYFLEVARAGQDVDYAVRAAGFTVPGVHFEGELAMNGELRPTRSVWNLPKDKVLVVPMTQRNLVAHFNPGQTVLGFQHLSQVLDFASRVAVPPTPDLYVEDPCPPDYAFQDVLRLATEAVRHGKNVWINSDTRGAGATILSKWIKRSLGPLSYEESLDLSRIYCSCGLEAQQLTAVRPFRAPHHTVTEQGILGNRQYPDRLGEISLAKYGVLLIDEVEEWSRRVLEATCDEARRRQQVVVLVSYPSFKEPYKLRQIDPEALDRWNAVEVKITSR